MVKCRSNIWFTLLIILSNISNGYSFVQCYLCADCGDPFDIGQPYTSIVTNQNYGAACIKTVLTAPYGKVVSRGTTFNCVPASTSDIKVYCCQSDLCNGSNSARPFSILLLLLFSFIFYLFSISSN